MKRTTLLFLSAAACAKTSPPQPTAAPVSPAEIEAAAEIGEMREMASAGVSNPEFRELLEDHWVWQMQVSPEWSTALGFRLYNAAVSDPSLAAAQAAEVKLQGFVTRALAMDTESLSPADQRYHTLFVDALNAQLESSIECRFGQWGLNPRGNIVSDLFSTMDLQPLETPEDADIMLRRMGNWAASVDAHLQSLQFGLESGLVTNSQSLTSILAQSDALLAQPVREWSFVERALASEPSGISETFEPSLLVILTDEVKPAMERYVSFLRDTLVPAARSDDEPGLSALSIGKACYQSRIAHYTTLPLTADELHRRGIEEMEKIHREFRALGPKTVGEEEISRIFESLRTNPDLYFSSAEEIVETAETALAAAEQAVPQWFGTLPKTSCVVTEIPAHEAPYTTIAYYRQPNPDGSKPGEYFVNTYLPETRPKYEAEVLAFHESVPGHHLQIALSFELPATPAFHRFDGSTAFVEGWALYTERLADEMGLYSDDLSRLGMLSFDSWRAARLVVDTGIHAMNWSRDEAISYMKAYTPLAENNIENEVDRYIAWPGQAVAYKTGQLYIRDLRASAEAELGESFEISGFHDALLNQGAVSLGLLKDQVDDWVAAQKTESQ